MSLNVQEALPKEAAFDPALKGKMKLVMQCHGEDPAKTPNRRCLACLRNRKEAKIAVVFSKGVRKV